MHLLFATSLLELISEMCQKRTRMKYGNNSVQSTEMGYVAHLTRLAEVIQEVASENEIVHEQLQEERQWKDFQDNFLKDRLELRSGKLCRGKQFEKQKESRFLSMFDDDEDDGDNKIEEVMHRRDDDYGGGLADQRTN